VVFTVITGALSWANARIEVQSLQTGQRRVLVNGATNGRYLPTGHLVYAQGGVVMAAPFDQVKLELTGKAVPVLEGVARFAPPNLAQFNFSSLGSLIYVSGGTSFESALVSVDRNGAVRPLAAPPHRYATPRLSPDGTRLAVTITENDKRDVWVYDMARGTLTRLTFDGSSMIPLWTADGRRLTFTTYRGGPPEIFWKPADGSGPEERLMTAEGSASVAESWSPNGQALTFSEFHPSTRSWDIWLFSLDAERKRQPLINTASAEQAAALSRDGRWLAYVSNESGRREVYVQPFPGPGGKWQISTEGGIEPVWNANGRELFFRNLNATQLWTVDITTQPTFSASKPRLLFEGLYNVAFDPLANYDVSADGRQFIMVRAQERSALPTQINIVPDWFDELKRRVPVE
jgi:serine/threonine-protein kinase